MGLVGNGVNFDGEYTFQVSSSFKVMGKVRILVNAKFE
jgi:hypothetical protein